MIQNALHETTILNLGPVTLLPLGEGKSFAIGSVAIAVFRTRSGQVFATQARCPHRGGPLADGTLGGTTVHCPLHGFAFDLSTGRPVGNDCKGLETLKIEVNGSGQILVHVPSAKLHALHQSMQP